MRRKGISTSIYYGLALIVSAFVVCSFLGILKPQKEKVKEVQKEKQIQEKQVQEEQAEMPVDNPDIRVLLMTDGYQNEVHPGISLAAEAGLKIESGEETEETEAGQELAIAPDDVRFQKGILRIQAKDGGEVTVSSIKRGYGTPSYAGTLELRTTAEGIVVINELPLEEYLCKVVPSEMPALYELEALKAQAVCARSYAYQQMKAYAYPEYEAHVNDSTDYQVYGNSQPQETSSQAVHETAGQVAKYQGQLATTYYYSTSGGKTTSLEAWGTEVNEQNQYLASVEVKGDGGDYERELPWYRWEAEIPVQTLSNLIGLNTGTDIGLVKSLEVTKRGPGEIAVQILASGEKGSVTVDTENKIRRALGGKGYKIKKQDGTTADSTALLPSAFFTVEKTETAFLIKGGGYGHGIGMSQNGANEMAKSGKSYIDILTLFFQGVAIEAGEN